MIGSWIYGFASPFCFGETPVRSRIPDGRGKGEAGKAGPARNRAADPCGGRR